MNPRTLEQATNITLTLILILLTTGMVLLSLNIVDYPPNNPPTYPSE